MKSAGALEILSVSALHGCPLETENDRLPFPVCVVFGLEMSLPEGVEFIRTHCLHHLV